MQWYVAHRCCFKGGVSGRYDGTEATVYFVVTSCVVRSWKEAIQLFMLQKRASAAQCMNLTFNIFCEADVAVAMNYVSSEDCVIVCMNVSRLSFGKSPTRSHFFPSASTFSQHSQMRRRQMWQHAAALIKSATPGIFSQCASSFLCSHSGPV